MPNTIRMKIRGMEYSITSDEDPAYIKGLASEIEQKFNKIKQKSPFLSDTMTAVVAALESLDDAKKIEAENEKLRLDIKNLLEESACAKLDCDLYRRQLDKILIKYPDALSENSQNANIERQKKEKTNKSAILTQDNANDPASADNMSLFDDLPF